MSFHSWFTGVSAVICDMLKPRRLFPGGSKGNEHLTAVVAALLLLLLFVEGATLLNVGALLTVHVFVGLLLIPIVALKLGSTGWRMLRYYLGSEEYVERGPPNVVLRTVVAPLIVLSTLVLFATGTALLALGETEGAVVGLHQASFIVWVAATGIHVLAHIRRLPVLLRLKAPGRGIRLVVVMGAVVTGLALATVAFPTADHLQDRVSAQVGLDVQ
jgi:hypothetical protein